MTNPRIKSDIRPPGLGINITDNAARSDRFQMIPAPDRGTRVKEGIMRPTAMSVPPPPGGENLNGAPPPRLTNPYFPLQDQLYPTRGRRVEQPAICDEKCPICPQVHKKSQHSEQGCRE